ncbi:hypothetical protein LTR56_000553 [Elasticomyces elasticus]|nr:hypothetical protein LTR56_000553 [Elasticomyces elasticus]KAK3664329.1 hypothetical protein LTR22_004742 [Elasticomyces elasticus]KAK4915439.1 hypothetical protein LTR49_016427 [Elasticomyces elasticus]KAK5752822.1 hypothetical protein LTS12_017101 [Elasticomyces elasticus]
MGQTVKLCKQHGVKIGAHPAYGSTSYKTGLLTLFLQGCPTSKALVDESKTPNRIRQPDVDKTNRMKLSNEELTAMVRYQVGALKAFLDAEDVPLNHVKASQNASNIVSATANANNYSPTACSMG